MAKDCDTPARGEQLKLIETDHAAARQIKRLIRQIRERDAEASAARGKASEARQNLLAVLQEHKLKTPCQFGDTIIDTKLRLSIKGKAEDEVSAENTVEV